MPLKQLQVRLDPDVERAIESLTTPGGLFPAFSGASAAHAANVLIRSSQQFKDAVAQAQSEKNPRPGPKR